MFKKNADLVEGGTPKLKRIVVGGAEEDMAGYGRHKQWEHSLPKFYSCNAGFSQGNKQHQAVQIYGIE